MGDKFIFSDEAGCFTFKRQNNTSRYFIICTVILDDCKIATDLLDLRREIIWDGKGELLGDYFHACNDSQHVRDKVYDVLSKHDFSIQATIMEKSKAQPHIRNDKSNFYKHGWYFHFRHGMTNDVFSANRTLVSAASIGNKREKSSFLSAINDVLNQTMAARWKVDFRKCKADPCLQVADYCAWAIQRKWELNDKRSYDIIKDKITREYDLWERGQSHFY